MRRLVVTQAAVVIGACCVGVCQARWESMGPGGGGWLWSLAVAPDEKGTVYLGCDVGGMYRSSDYGRRWKICNEGLWNTYVAAIAVDPANPRVVYAGTHGGVYKSVDGGEHWRLKREGFPAMETWGMTAPVAAVAVSPADSDLVLAGIGEPRRGKLPKTAKTAGIWTSRDGAETWEHVNTPTELASAQIYSILFSPHRPTTVLAAGTAGVFRSDDSGRTWRPSASGLPRGAVMELAADRQAGVFYATFCDEGSRSGGVARSDDWGASWRVVRRAEGRDWQYWRIVSNPKRAGVVYASVRRGPGIFSSADGGRTWERVTRDDNVKSAWFYRGFTCTALAIDPRQPERLYYANDMEIYGTADGGKTWQQLCTDLVREPSGEEPALWRGRGVETTCSSALAVARGYPQLIYLGYWDTGLWRSTDGGRTWAWVTQWMGYGKAAAIVVDPERPWRAWLSFGRNYGPHRIWRTDDYGRDWRLVGYEDTGLPTGAIFCLALDPTSSPDARVLYAPVVGRGVYRSDDGGESWRRVDVDIGENLHFTNIALDPRNPGRMFAGVRYWRKEGRLMPGGVFLSRDGGKHWSRVADIRERPRVFVAPSRPEVVYVAERDYSSVGKGGVYRSTDGGRSWRLMVERLDAGFGNLARTYVGAIAIDTLDPDLVYASSTDEQYDINCGKGVFVSRDGGRTWVAMNEGLSHKRVMNLLVDPNAPRRVYAGTSGNGYFRWGAAPAGGKLPQAPEVPQAADPLCMTTKGWRCTADGAVRISVREEKLWWGRGYVQMVMGGGQKGISVVKHFPRRVDISGAHIMSLRMRGRNADGTPLVVARVILWDEAGRKLVYEKDIRLPTVWTLAELPLRDWAAEEEFDRKAVGRLELHIWAPYPQAKPCELAVGRISFRARG